jgi:hypothetical protein
MNFYRKFIHLNSRQKLCVKIVVAHMSTYINDLPMECIALILQNVVICTFTDGESRLGSLNKCGGCVDNNIECKHLTLAEVTGIKFLKLVCRKWHQCISMNFKFVSAPEFRLPSIY